MALQKFNAAGGLTVGSNITVIDTTGAVTSTDITANGVFIGNGANITNLNASNLASGTVPADRLTGTYNISVSGSAGTANSVAGNNVSGEVAFAAVANSVAGANVDGPVANATFATTASSATTATTAGTVTNAAQTNITSVGTLTGLTVTSAINGSVTGSAATVTNAAQPAITSLGILTSLTVSTPINADISGSAASATTAGTVTTAAQPNITSVGNLTSLTVNGALTTTNITTGANTTAGTLTGNWTLSAGSRLESTYADLGERYTSDVQYEAGTVVMFGGTHEVTVSTHEGRLKVAGVVSTQPAYVLNSTAPDSVVIALSGRVPCKVDCDVKRGDLLSVGHMPGHATVTEFVIPGAMVGKAISDSANGIVEIQVWKS